MLSSDAVSERNSKADVFLSRDAATSVEALRVAACRKRRVGGANDVGASEMRPVLP